MDQVENQFYAAEDGLSARSWVNRLAGVCALVACVGLFVRLTIRDAWVPASTIYYAFPFPVLALLWALAAGLWWSTGTRRWGGLAACGALACLGGVAYSGYAWGHGSSQERPTAECRLVFWNISRGDEGWPRIFEALRETGADIVASVEASERFTEERGPWEQAMGDYALSSMEGQMILACRGEILSEKMLQIGAMGRLKHCRVQLHNGTQLSVVLVDVLSDPLRSREGTLRALAEFTDTLRNEPFVVVGDFNTPGDSIYFGPLRHRCKHAVETSAQGYMATWPVPFPVLQIDHVWGNQRIQFIQTRLAATRASDHKMILCELDVVEGSRTEDLAQGVSF